MNIDQIEASSLSDNLSAFKEGDIASDGALPLLTLDLVKPGTRVEILGVSSSNRELFRKLHVMGMYTGATATVICKAPLGDPISISTLGYVLSLRMSEARTVTVRLLP